MSNIGNYKHTKSEKRRKDYTGQKYNKLTFIKYIENDKWGKAIWECKCECGKSINIVASAVTTGKTKSCGCIKANLKPLYKHGMRNTRFWKIWTDMKQRCSNPNDSHYKYYGGRGITFCDEWNDFINFKNDMYDSYLEHCEKYGEKDTTIDRIDVNGNYCKENCKWESIKNQNNNRSNNVIVYDNNGNELTLKEFSDLNNINYKCALNRYYRSKYKGTKRVPSDIIKYSNKERQHRANQSDCE